MLTLMMTLVSPAAAYMYYRPMVPLNSLGLFDRAFSSPFDSMFDELMHTTRALAAPRPLFGSSLVASPTYRNFNSFAQALDMLEPPLSRRPSWVERDDLLEMSFKIEPDARLHVEVVEGDLMIKATLDKDGVQQQSTTYSVSLPFDVDDARAVQALRDSNGAKLTLRVPLSAKVKPSEPERVQLEIKEVAAPSKALPDKKNDLTKEIANTKSVEEDFDDKFAFVKEAQEKSEERSNGDDITQEQ